MLWPGQYIHAREQERCVMYKRHITIPRVSVLLCIISLTLLGTQLLNSAHTTKLHAANDKPAIGINLTGLSDYSGDFLFADVMQEARGWGSAGTPWDSTAKIDENGWPTQDAGVVILSQPANNESINGTYKLSFTGQATVSGVASDVKIQNQVYDANTNTTTADIMVGTNSQLDLGFTSTKRLPTDTVGTGITNVKLMMPTSIGANVSYDPSTTFTDQAKAEIDKFQAIRFMDFSATNGNTQVNWSDRRLPTYSSQASSGSKGGGAWEYAIQLCNETGKDAYINVPEMADNDYITQLANLFKYGSDANGKVYTSSQDNPVYAPLKSSLHLYIEYSNEVWNFAYGFMQSQQNIEAVKNDIANNTAELAVINYDNYYPGNGPDAKGDYLNQWQLGYRHQAERIKETSDIFRTVFGDDAMMNQVRPLLEWQYGNANDIANIELSFLDNYYNNADGQQHSSAPHPVNYYLWGGGGAAYSGVKNADAGTIDDIYNSGLDTSIVGGTVATDATFTKKYNLHDIAYEGGFNIGGDAPTDLQKQANLDSRAKQMEINAQNTFTQSGGELLMYFNSTGSSAYGLASPTVFDLSTPKLQAIDALNQ